MGRHPQIQSVDKNARLLESILAVMETETFGKTLSAKIVGGTEKLKELIVQGKVESHKPCNVRNGKWFCNAADVLRHCRDMRRLKGKERNKKVREDNNK